jgi:predicted phosphodiesterase
MKIGIISDIHSNNEAIDSVLENTKEVDEFICLGDIVGYGADPNDCIEKIKDLKFRCIGGNHDFAVVGKLDINYFNHTAREAIFWTSLQLKKENLNFLKKLEKKIELKDNVIAVHGSPQNPLVEYILDKDTANLIFSKFVFKICFVGHSHLAGCFSFNEDNNQMDYINFSHGGHIEISENKRYIINCGSVGQPRDGNPKASYGIYDLKNNAVNIYRVPYRFNLTQDKIINAGLPRSLADRLSYGR